jgi:3-hydroxybutyryl-CoA dehydrogenase
MGSVLKRPQHLVGMHFFNPAPIMALVEIVRSKDTASAVADTVFTLAEKWGKSPVNVRSSPGSLSIVSPVHFTVKHWRFSKKA